MNSRPAFSWFQNTAAPQARPVASKITIKQFYLPGGSSTQLKGVPSDIALPSVNEFLPIGESDLPHALAWDEIPEVDWFNDWKKLSISSPEEPKLKTALAHNSTARQASLAEFTFLKEQIEWRKARYDKKAISLDLEQRITSKIEDRIVINRMDDAYESLRETNYAEQDFILEVALEQDALSKQNLLEKAAVEVALDDAETANDPAASVVAIEPDQNDTIEEEDKPNFDIYLRESARIMADWIELEATDKAATSATKIAVTTGVL
jgi:carboxyl-terminal processing protease